MINDRHRFYAKYGKRVLDIVCAALALVLFCWLYAIIALLVRIKLGSPVIFRQERPGKIDPKTGRERIFKLYKFRTMTDGRDAQGNLLPDEVRLTKFGRTLRATSLDELPEAWNILRGDMSVVGPRPLMVKYLPLYSEQQHHRHDVLPGLTGMAQVHGRNAISWEEKFNWDLKYVREQSLACDVGIFFKTVFAVLRRDGINSADDATMPDFTGTEPSSAEEG